MIGAGTDTVSMTLLWLLALMCHHPDAQKRASAEIDAFIRVNGHIPNFKDKSELPFCISVMKESMRMRPTTSFGLPHCIHEDGNIRNKYQVKFANFYNFSRGGWLYPSKRLCRYL
jgi:cytochrome P450